jgi:hypothetical protein
MIGEDSPLQVLLVLAASLAVIALIGSVVFPALSAGILPLVLGQSGWIYPACIFTSCSLLAVVAYILHPESARQSDVAKRAKVAESWEMSRILVYLSFVSFMASAAYFLSRPLLLFPPLAVLAFEALVRVKTCTWINRPVALVCLFVVASTGSYAIFGVLGASPVTITLVMAFAIACMTWLDLYAPPAIVIAILPYTTVEAGWFYPIDAGGSVLALAIVSTFFERTKIFDQGISPIKR